MNNIDTLGQLCIMTEMGWIDTKDDIMYLDNNKVMADISSLPTEVSVHLTGTKFEMCVAKIGEVTMKYVAKYDFLMVEEACSTFHFQVS